VFSVCPVSIVFNIFLVHLLGENEIYLFYTTKVF
jgi:hypothetical protein